MPIDLGLEEYEEQSPPDLTAKKKELKKVDAMYVTVPDVHAWDKTIGSHRDYKEEVKETMDRVKDEVVRLRPLCERLYVIMAGDLFHKGFTNMDEFGYWMTWYLDLRAQVDDVFATVGNHEFSSYKNNPFWHLFQTMESTSIPQMKGVANTPKGKMDIIRVTDIIQEGNWHIHCVHYGTRAQLLQEEKNVGIFHNSIIDNEIEKVLRDKYGRDPLTGYIDHLSIRNNKPFKGMEYVFVAHMHKAFGLFTIEEEQTRTKTRLQYMASIGRTNINEYDDNDLKRVLPVLCFSNDELVEVYDIEIELWNRARAIDETLVEEKQDKYQEQKEIRQFERSVAIIGRPVDELRGMLVGHSELLFKIDTAVRGDVLPSIKDLTEKVYGGVDIDGIKERVRKVQIG